MKTIILALILLPTLSFAADKASDSEKALLCGSVDKYMQDNMLDMAMDLDSCLLSTTIESKLFSEGLRVVEGVLIFNAPSRPSFTQKCAIAYIGQPTQDHSIGGISCE